MPGADGPAPDPVSLDLLPPHLLLPRARRVALASVLVGIVLGVVAWLFVPMSIAVALGLIFGLPPAVGAFVVTRRHLRLGGTVLTASGVLRSRSVELRHLAGVELLVRVGRVSQVILRVNDGEHRLVSVPLALYADGGGRELDVLALRRLADALATAELAPAAAVSSVLLEQLRAEARSAALEERPLYRAIDLARRAGRVPQTTLTDHEVAALVE
ncbi:hypothetical protein [Rhodococcus phenolicus]|uniref:hypothetical protein n=1 Tax=Rhodococcus phenolicus TaxID=263849 RepID=UPI00082C44A9|nr:hypothetical protein [Rhodococcus phenolicus]